jgi:hypothetical protein
MRRRHSDKTVQSLISTPREHRLAAGGVGRTHQGRHTLAEYTKVSCGNASSVTLSPDYFITLITVFPVVYACQRLTYVLLETLAGLMRTAWTHRTYG